jgi:hypothetical protein
MLFRLHDVVIFIKLLNFYVMAKNNSGVLGNFIGTIGPVNGRDLLRFSTSSVNGLNG